MSSGIICRGSGCNIQVSPPPHKPLEEQLCQLGGKSSKLLRCSRVLNFFYLAQGGCAAPLTSTVSYHSKSMCADRSSSLRSHSVEEKFSLVSDTCAHRKNGAKIAGIWHTSRIFERP